jgi:hypothetical protein
MKSSTSRFDTTRKSTQITEACVRSEWGPWTKCSAECKSDSSQSRTRQVSNDTACSDPSDETRLCNQSACQQCTLTREACLEQLDSASLNSGQ